MSGNPSTTPPSNVVPINPVAAPTNWPGPMFNPGARPWPQSPSCFSELAGLNACYDSVQMMEQILAKVVCDLATNNAAFAQCLVEAIAKSGSSVPLIGVTNGSDAQPGQVGEFFAPPAVAFPVPAGNNTVNITTGVLQPGDWDLWSDAAPGGAVQVLYFSLNPQPPGFSSNGGGYSESSGGAANATLGLPTRALISVPTLLAWTITTQAATAVTGSNFYCYGRRRR